MIKSTYLTVEASSLLSLSFPLFLSPSLFSQGVLLCNALLVFPTGSYAETAGTRRSALLALVSEATLRLFDARR